MKASENLQISAKEATLLQQLFQLQSQTPIEALTQFALQSTSFCDQMLNILFPKRRPPTITNPVIQQCVRQLGSDRAQLLFTASTIISIFNNRIKTPQFSKNIFWLDSLRRGFVAQTLAEELSYPNPYEAFIASFLSEIGTLILAIRQPHNSPLLANIRTRKSDIRFLTEKLLTGNTHTEEISSNGLSSLLPPRILQSILNKHQAYPLDNQQAFLTCIVSTATTIGDIAQAYPKKDVVQEAEKALRVLTFYHQDPISLEMIFTAAETSVSLIGQDLGLDTSFALDFGIISDINSLLDFLDTSQEELFESSSKQFEKRQDLICKIEQLRDSKTPYSLLLLNIDHFRQINLGYGFPTGDNLLHMLSQKMLRSMRSTDHISYIGQDDFLFLLPNTSITGGRIVGGRLRSLIKSVYLTMGMQRIGCTASIGGVSIPEPEDETFALLWPQLLAQLKQAKNKGRNRVSWLKD